MSVVLAIRPPDTTIELFWARLPEKRAFDIIVEQSLALIEHEAMRPIHGARREALKLEIETALLFAHNDGTSALAFMLEIAEFDYGYGE